MLDPSNTSKVVYADRGHPSAERESALKQAGWQVHIQRWGHATKGISAAQKRRNRRIATPRAGVEHVFGALAQMGGKRVRCLGILRTTFALYLKAASYNLKRLVFLKGRGLAPFQTARGDRPGGTVFPPFDPLARSLTLILFGRAIHFFCYPQRRLAGTFSFTSLRKPVIPGGLKD